MIVWLSEASPGLDERFNEQLEYLMDSRGRFHRKQEEEIKTETFLDSLVRRMTVYAVALIGLFLIIKEFLLGKLAIWV